MLYLIRVLSLIFLQTRSSVTILDIFNPPPAYLLLLPIRRHQWLLCLAYLGMKGLKGQSQSRVASSEREPASVRRGQMKFFQFVAWPFPAKQRYLAAFLLFAPHVANIRYKGDDLRTNDRLAMIHFFSCAFYFSTQNHFFPQNAPLLVSVP